MTSESIAAHTRPVFDFANDNATNADSFATLADRRAWLATLPAHAEPVLAWPTLERLGHLRDNEVAVRALLRWRDLNQPAVPTAANDNDPAASKMDDDFRREMRPSVSELLRAVKDVDFEEEIEPDDRPGGKRQRSTGRMQVGGDVEYLQGDVIRMGTLSFGVMPTTPRGAGNNRAIIAWGFTKKGKALLPVDRVTAPKGQAKRKRAPDDVQWYLARHGTGWPERYSGPAEARIVDVDRSEETQEAADFLTALGVGGTVDFDTARRNAGLAPAERGPTFMHPAAKWIGGVTHLRNSPNTRQPDIGELAAETEMARRSASSSVRRMLTASEAKILDLAITDATAAEIGAELGYSGSYAKKLGAKLIDGAISAFIATQTLDTEKIAA